MARIGLPEAARKIVRSLDISEAELQTWKYLFDADEDAFLKKLEQKSDRLVWSLCFFINVSGETYKRYRELRVDEHIFFDTLSDITLWCLECFQRHGVYGLTEIPWLCKSMKLKLFRLGRLQFEPLILQNALAVGEHSYPLGTEYLFVHIPAGKALVWEDCVESFNLANSFFDSTFKLYLCDSWLLSPALTKVLPKGSRILRFQEFFTIIKMDEENLQAEERIFGKVLEDKKLYSENTSLQLKAKEFLLSGRKLGVGTGFRPRI